LCVTLRFRPFSAYQFLFAYLSFSLFFCVFLCCSPFLSSGLPLLSLWFFSLFSLCFFLTFLLSVFPWHSFLSLLYSSPSSSVSVCLSLTSSVFSLVVCTPPGFPLFFPLAFRLLCLSFSHTSSYLLLFFSLLFLFSVFAFSLFWSFSLFMSVVLHSSLCRSVPLSYFYFLWFCLRYSISLSFSLSLYIYNGSHK